MRFVFLAPLFLVGCAAISSPKVPVPTVSQVDLTRYSGRWYVIANIPYFLEKGKVASYDTYTLLPDGRLQNDFTFRKGSLDAPEKTWHGHARVVNTTTHAEWKVQFIWPLSTTYLVIDLDPDYRWSVVGTPNRKLLWVLSRDRQLSAATYAEIMTRIEQRGYTPSQLVKVPQPAN